MFTSHHNNQNRQRELISACELGHLDEVNSLLASDPALVNERERNRGSTALHKSVSCGNNDIIRTLIAHLANVNAEDNFGWTPLNVACFNGNFEAVKILIGVGKAAIGVPNRVERRIPLHTAIQSGNIEITKFLIESIDEQKPSYCLIHFRDHLGKTPFILACMKGLPEIVDMMLNIKCGCPQSAESAHSKALFHACSSGNIEIVRMLVDKFKNLATLTDSDAASALDEAILNSHLGMIQLLVSKGARFELCNAGIACLHECGADVKAINKRMYSMSRYADFSIARLFPDIETHVKFLTLLVRSGAFPRNFDYFSYTFFEQFGYAYSRGQFIPGELLFQFAEAFFSCLWLNSSVIYSFDLWSQLCQKVFIKNVHLYNFAFADILLSLDFKNRMFPMRLQVLAKRIILSRLSRKYHLQFEEINALASFLPQLLLEYLKE